MRRPRRVVVRAAAWLPLFTGLAWAQDPADLGAQFDWLREYLFEFSIVTDGDDAGARDVMTTRLDRHPEPDRATLSYSRASYAGPAPDSLHMHQTIHYDVKLDSIAADSVRVQSWDAFNSGESFWLVHAVIADDADFVEYTNVFERRLEDGRVDVTSSRGRVRELVLGYFSDETTAARFAENFRDMIERLSDAPSDIQSDAAH